MSQSMKQELTIESKGVEARIQFDKTITFD